MNDWIYRIMVVDANVALSEVTVLSIEYGLPPCRAMAVADAATALRVLRQKGPFSLLVVDPHLRVENEGLLLIRQVRSGDSENHLIMNGGTPRDIPIILTPGDKQPGPGWPQVGQTRTLAKDEGHPRLHCEIASILNTYKASYRLALLRTSRIKQQQANGGSGIESTSTAGSLGSAPEADACELVKIMAVDDEWSAVIISEGINQLLPGHVATPVADIGTALRMLREEGPFHCITVDLNLRVPNEGLLLIRKIRSGSTAGGPNGTPRDIPILVISGISSAISMWPRAGQTINIEKPVEPRALSALVSSVLVAHRAGDRTTLDPTPLDDALALDAEFALMQLM